MNHSKVRPRTGIVVACALTVAAVIHAAPVAAGFAEAMQGTKPSLEIRYRLETVDQDGFEKDARASTARARLSWIMPPEEGFSVGVEGDYVFAMPPGTRERFNSTENGRTEYPVVADPTDFDLNQAFLRYRSEDLTLTAGRQTIRHADTRFVGDVAWRQNPQTFDGLRLQYGVGNVSLDYSYVINVNRIFGPGDGAQPGDWKGDSHLFRASLKMPNDQSIGAFAYLLDFENANGPPNSTETYGMDFRGKLGPLSLTAAIARQSDWARNPLSYTAMYYQFEARVKRGPVALTAGYEVLGSDGGRAAFRTPLATLHKFQGWTDKFLGTPPAGVEDAYAKASTRIGPAAVAVAFHRFQAAKGSDDYGTEIGATVSFTIRERLSALLKFAHYNADEHATDTSKIWIMLTYRF